jgi:hypothetical protein
MIPGCGKSRKVREYFEMDKFEENVSARPNDKIPADKKVNRIKGLTNNLQIWKVEVSQNWKSLTWKQTSENEHSP